MCNLSEIESCVLVPQETDFLAECARKSKHNFIELGSLYGRSSVVLGKVAKEKGVRLFSVDLWEDDEIFQKWQENIKGAGLEKVVVPIRMDTKYAWTLLKSLYLKFDLLFIDADHETESVRADYENYLPLLEPPAYVVFHDIDTGSVRKVFDDIDGEKVEHGNLGNVWIKGDMFR
jgi:predicted O-methyltransferase YrrM